MEKFDATGVTKVKSGNVSNPVAPSVNESWVTVSPKKRVKAMIQAKPRGDSILNSERKNKVGGITHHSSSIFTPYHNPAPLGSEDIILANVRACKSAQLQCPEGDPLAAIDAGVEDDTIDAYLNPHHFEDVDMSSDSSKRKRLEEGEEASSRGPN